jgi:hypothetical protein
VSRCLLSVAVASSAVLALLVLPDCMAAKDAGEDRAVELGASETVRVKGLQPHLVIHRKRAELIELLHTGQMAHRGDVLQISYVAAGHQYGVVVSIDGSGTVTLHHPASRAASTRLQKRGETPLPTAFELDAAPSFERFILVISGDTPTDIDLVMSSARALPPAEREDGLLALPAHYDQFTTVLRKSP